MGQQVGWGLVLAAVLGAACAPVFTEEPGHEACGASRGVPVAEEEVGAYGVSPEQAVAEVHGSRPEVELIPFSGQSTHVTSFDTLLSVQARIAGPAVEHTGDAECADGLHVPVEVRVEADAGFATRIGEGVLVARGARSRHLWLSVEMELDPPLLRMEADAYTLACAGYEGEIEHLTLAFTGEPPPVEEGVEIEGGGGVAPIGSWERLRGAVSALGEDVQSGDAGGCAGMVYYVRAQ